MSKITVEQCIQALSAQCDGAISRDGKGFNGVHATTGNLLAALPQELWGDDTIRYVWQHVLPTYTKQLLSYGLDLAEVEAPPKVTNLPYSVSEMNTRLHQRRREHERLASRIIRLQDNLIIVSFDYDQALVSALKVALPYDTRAFNRDGKYWEVKPSAKAELLRFAVQNSFYVEQDVRDLVAPKLSLQPVRIRAHRCEIKPDHILVYFPYSSAMLDHIKDIPGRRFVKDQKCWRIPRREESLGMLQGFIMEYPQFNADYDRVSALVDAVETVADRQERLSAAVESDEVAVDTKQSFESLTGTLRPFQEVGIAFAQENKQVLIADAMGIGKTIEAAGFLGTTKGALPAVCVVPKGVLINWAIELLSWIPDVSVSIIKSGRKGFNIGLKNGQRAHVPANNFEADIVILNYAILSKHLDALRMRSNNTVVLDESHMVKNLKAKRTQAVHALGEGVENKLCLTGTPVMNRPAELISPLKFLGRLDDFGGRWEFSRRYCNGHKAQWGWDESGAYDLEDLHEKMRRGGMFLRRTKDQVLDELPDKQRTTIPLPLDKKVAREYHAAVQNFIVWLSQNADSDANFLESIEGLPTVEQEIRKTVRREEKVIAARKAEHLVRIEALKQLAVKAKMEAILQWVENFKETGQKLVLFGIHKEPIQELARYFNAPTITGADSAEVRQTAIDAFQDPDSDCWLLVCNLQAGGVGITLNAAADVATFEYGWSPGLHDQAEDRLHRMGQKNAVNCWYLLAEGTIDEEIARLIEAKRVVIDAVTDGIKGAPKEGMIGDLTKFIMSLATEKTRKMRKFRDELEQVLFD